MYISNNNVMNNKKMLIKTLVISGVLAVVTACSSPAPTHITVSPELHIAPAPTNLYNNSTQLNVVDMRVAKAIVTISKEDEAALLLSSKEGLDNIINEKLSAGWKSQGLNTEATAKNKITVNIEQAFVRVKQSTMSYVTTSSIAITVKVNNGGKVLTSKFKNKGTSDGALSADIAVLERDFNHNLASVLETIILSKDIQKFLAP